MQMSAVDLRNASQHLMINVHINQTAAYLASTEPKVLNTLSYGEMLPHMMAGTVQVQTCEHI